MAENSIIVSKFGGSSMADAEAIKRSAAVAALRGSNVVIVSATYGTTNDLLNMIQLSLQNDWPAVKPIYQKVFDSHIKICADLEVNAKASEQVTYLLKELKALIKGVCLLKDCSLKAKDNILSHGERLSSIFMREALSQLLTTKQVSLFDARDLIMTNNSYGAAVPNIRKIAIAAETKIKPFIVNGEVFVSQGFIGRSEEGLTSTLGRGGSDYSASLFAEAIDADLIEIWTDVAGVASMDPRICKNAKILNEITYQEASELATFGAKVLHPTSLWPAMRKNIPVYVASSMEPEKTGTMITGESEAKPLVRAIALRQAQSLVTITTPRMVNTHGFLQSVFSIFTDLEISVDLVTTSEISVAITLNQSTAITEKLIDALKEIGHVEVEQDLALISLVGSNISQTAGLSREIFSNLSDTNVRMICQGASPSSICFLVSATNAIPTVQALHMSFLES